MSPRATLNRKAAARVLIHIYPYMVYMYMYTLFTQNEEVISFVSIAVNTENGLYMYKHVSYLLAARVYL